MGAKGFLMKPVATGDLAEMVRKVLDEVKGTTQQYVILFLSFGRSGNINNTKRMLHFAFCSNPHQRHWIPKVE